ncbi:divalent-cation tolerance protein CutA [Streptomyces sp. DSM 44917]|uniref:Divalent-cation tolerance protein CutA n=1 Tax=Streptomyces boetiae TaxID=3075541 RepID=A0ABU2L3R2_9ACTN|nr:divalent-cation tolerance protein CutA [Streptomyces sp. DSM 44917]MDT0306056.1 divalent-cation tolerance protein CutA [Streptomyces sp. DSM 44917]
MTGHLTVLTTTDSREAALALARSPVEARVAACAQADGPVTSVYRWEGEIRTDEEWRVLFKTPAARYEAPEAHLRAAHAYDTPEIIAADITHGSDAYLTWLATETTSTAGPLSD